MRLLYVEDNPANLFLVQRIARMGNHEVVHYSDGQSALENFEHDKPDLVLMDVQLPGKLNGLDVVKLLRQRGHKTPIVAVTAYAMVGDRERCLEAGCDSYISKPLPVAELVELIKRFDPQSTANQAKLAAPAEAKIQAVQTVQTVSPAATESKTESSQSAASESLVSAQPVNATPDAEAIKPANVESLTSAVEAKPETPQPARDTELLVSVTDPTSPARPEGLYTEPVPHPVGVQEAVSLPEKQADKTG